MTTPLSQFPKPEAEQYHGRRKLYLVPNFAFGPDAPEEAQDLLERYWSEVRDHINNLERSLGSVAHVYHETMFVEGEEGMKLLDGLNPKGYSFIQAMCSSTARLEATEDRALVEESSDWQRCISVGLMSEKVMKLAMDSLQEVTQSRYQHMSSRIDETLQEGEAAVLFVREDHRIQFPTDVQVFYVAPPALDALKRWMSDRLRPAAPPGSESPESEQSVGEGEPAESEQSAEEQQPQAPEESEQSTEVQEPQKSEESGE